MPWIKMKGIAGRVFDPGPESDNVRKHHCPDCLHCAWCSDARCAICVNRQKCLNRRTCPNRQKHRRKNV